MMKKNILKIFIGMFVFLMFFVQVMAVDVSIDCDGRTPGVDTSVECSLANPVVQVSYYLSAVTASLDQIAVRLDYDNSLLSYGGAGLNKGLGRTEFMESDGADATAFGVEIDANTVDTTGVILGDCVSDGNCPTGAGNALKIVFDCVAEGTVYCNGGSPSLSIIDTRVLETTKTWWAEGDLESGGEKRLFESAACDDDPDCDYLDDDCAEGVCDGGECEQQFFGASRQCTGSAGACDVAESCVDGIAACPADAKVAAGTACRGSAGACDLVETCDGINDACPSDALAPATTRCRVAAGACDADEFCSGSSAACPADAKVAAGTTCRGAAGACDVEEQCNGVSVACPADARVAAGTECRAVAGDCDDNEVCDGTSALCPDDSFLSGVQCRASAGACDVAESCTGSSATCPGNSYRPNGYDCGICAECSGGACVYDATQDGDCDGCGSDGCTDYDGDFVIDDYVSYGGGCEAIYVCGSCEPTVSSEDDRCSGDSTLLIESGWDLVSLPLAPESGFTFGDIQDRCSSTLGFYWNPHTRRYAYLSRASDELYAGQGYWIKSPSSCEVPIDGYDFTIGKVGYLGSGELFDTWNLVGATSNRIDDINDFSGTCDIAFQLFGYGGDAYYRTWTLSNGQGYWLKVNGDCSLG